MLVGWEKERFKSESVYLELGHKGQLMSEIKLDCAHSS